EQRERIVDRLDRVARSRADRRRLWGRSCDHVANITLTRSQISADPRAPGTFTAVRTTRGYDRAHPAARTDLRWLLRVAALRRSAAAGRSSRAAEPPVPAAGPGPRVAARSARPGGPRSARPAGPTASSPRWPAPRRRPRPRRPGRAAGSAAPTRPAPRSPAPG